MIFESKQSSDDKITIHGNQRVTHLYGSLTVSGFGTIKIPCRGRPLEIAVGFSDPLPLPSGCGPIEEDTVDIAIDQLLKPFPLWAIKISWDIKSGNVREIVWDATILQGGRHGHRDD